MWENQLNTAKQKDGLTSFLTLNVLEARIFQYNFLQGHDLWQNNCYWLSTQRNVVDTKATKREILVTEDEMSVSLATILVTISSTGIAFKILRLCQACRLVKRKGQIGPFLFWEPSLIPFSGIPAITQSGGNTAKKWFFIYLQTIMCTCTCSLTSDPGSTIDTSVPFFKMMKASFFSF